MAKIVRLTESDLVRLVKKIVKEQDTNPQSYTDKTGYHDPKLTSTVKTAVNTFGKNIQKDERRKKELDNSYVKYMESLFAKKEFQKGDRTVGPVKGMVQNIASKNGINDLSTIYVAEEGQQGGKKSIIVAVAKIDNYRYKVLIDTYNMFRLGRLPQEINVEKMYNLLRR